MRYSIFIQLMFCRYVYKLNDYIFLTCVFSLIENQHPVFVLNNGYFFAFHMHLLQQISHAGTSRKATACMQQFECNYRRVLSPILDENAPLRCLNLK